MTFNPKTFHTTSIIMILLIKFQLGGLCQFSNLGNPPIISYPKSETKAGTQTWGIAEDNFGYTWFANNSGLLKFDGYRWDIFPVPNNTIVRSVVCDNKEHKVYVGSQGEFGFFSADKRGNFKYTSLSQRLNQKDRKFEDVWQTINSKHGIFFRTNYQIFRYHNGKTYAVFPNGKAVKFLCLWGSEVVIQDNDNQLYTFDGNKFVSKKTNSLFNNGQISSVINLATDTVLITTLNNGIFKETKNGFEQWKTSNDEFIKSSVIYYATSTSDKKVILGTTYNGLIVIDENKKIITNIGKKSGLQNNAVLSVAATKTGNVWLGLDNGIDLVNMKSPFKVFYPDEILQSTGYVSILHNDNLYFGTNTGLYSIPWKRFYDPSDKVKSTFVKNSSGQVWMLQDIDGELWMGHHDGAFKIYNNSSTKVSNILGGWKFIKTTDGNLLTGNYQGLSILTKSSNWQKNEPIEGFSESARILYNDANNNLWISHPYRGIYYVSADDIKQRKTKENLFNVGKKDSQKLMNMIFKIDGKIIVLDAEKIYSINAETFKVELHPYLNNYISAKEGLKYMLQDEYKNIWYGTNKESGLLVPEKSFKTSYTKYVINELNGRLVEGFQSVNSIDRENVIFPTEKGFLLFNPSQYIYDTTNVKLFLSKVVLKADGDSIIYQGSLSNQSSIPTIALNYDDRNISFLFSVKDYPNKNLIEYSYKLSGVNSTWSEWTKSSELNFNNIAPGSYILTMKARNQNGIESNGITFDIKVSPQWYRSVWAYIIYGLLLICLIAYIIYRQQKIHEEEKRKVEEENLRREKEHQLNAQLSKEEIIRLQNEKLQNELNFKNQELASFTYHLVTKNELITEIKKTVDKLSSKIEDDKELKKEVKNIKQLTDQNSNMDDDWENFIKSFDQVHSGFFKRLNEEFKDLSPNDYKMCTCLKMNMTSKEIASFMNISIRSVETNRYRLRKKLGLHKDDNLTQFIMNY